MILMVGIKSDLVLEFDKDLQWVKKTPKDLLILIYLFDKMLKINIKTHHLER